MTLAHKDPRDLRATPAPKAQPGHKVRKACRATRARKDCKVCKDSPVIQVHRVSRV